MVLLHQILCEECYCIRFCIKLGDFLVETTKTETTYSVEHVLCDLQTELLLLNH